jgi:hypothetical protein
MKGENKGLKTAGLWIKIAGLDHSPCILLLESSTSSKIESIERFKLILCSEGLTELAPVQRLSPFDLEDLLRRSQQFPVEVRLWLRRWLVGNPTFPGCSASPLATRISFQCSRGKHRDKVAQLRLRQPHKCIWSAAVAHAVLAPDGGFSMWRRFLSREV